MDRLDDEYPVFAGPNSNSRQKAGPHIDLPLLPTLSKSRIVSYEKIDTKENTIKHSVHSIVSSYLTINATHSKRTENPYNF